MLTLILNIIAFLLIGFFLLMGLASFYCCLKAESHEEWWTYLRATILFNCGWAVVGDRASFLRLINSLLDTYKPDGVLIWLSSESDALRAKFGGRAPRDLIREGDWQPLLDEADRLAAGPVASRAGAG